MNLAAPSPGFWMVEQSGVLAPVVEAYLNGGRLSDYGVGIMRRYLVQWIEAPLWDLAPDCPLVAQAHAISNQREIGEWIREALAWGIDPL